MAETVPEPEWKKIRLSLERPYKDDTGQPIPTLYDITPEGEFLYEPNETQAERLAVNLRRIFQERGIDFFDKERAGHGKVDTVADLTHEGSAEGDVEPSDTDAQKVMTMEELYNMKSEILPQLFVALGEMSHARDLLNAILTDTPNPQSQNEPSSSTSLSATIITKPPQIISVQAFNAQVTIGSKDETLRKAASMFKLAAESMERTRVQGEKYWVDALRIRRANWGLSPAPLPFGSTTGKGADKTSKDFVISYGLEGCAALSLLNRYNAKELHLAPPASRRQAVAHLSTAGSSSSDIIFPYHQHTRLRITISILNDISTQKMTFDSAAAKDASNSLDSRLRTAQREAVDQEIFSILVNEASKLPTASARVSERLIAIDAAQGMDLTFELVDATSAVNMDQTYGKAEENICTLIYDVLRVSLIRRHGVSGVDKPESSRTEQESYAILQPVIDILQYGGFCKRVEAELRKVIQSLKDVGIRSTLSFTAVGEPGQHLVSLLSASTKKKMVGGEAVINVDNWNTIWFTFLSPSTLTAHLPQATLTVLSLPQLTQLLMDEIERCLLQRICQLGRELCDIVGGIWFIDLNRCVARWEGCLLNFRIFYNEDFKIGCSAFRLDNSTGKEGYTRLYDSTKQPLLEWAAEVIRQSSNRA